MASLFADEVQKDDGLSADDRRRADIARKGDALNAAMNAFTPTARKNDAVPERHIPSSLVAGQLDRTEDECRAAGTVANEKFSGARQAMKVDIDPRVARLDLPDLEAKILTLVVKADDREGHRKPIPASRLFEKMMGTDPEFRKEYEAIGPAYAAAWARIDATRCNVLQRNGTVSENGTAPHGASSRR